MARSGLFSHPLYSSLSQPRRVARQCRVRGSTSRDTNGRLPPNAAGKAVSGFETIVLRSMVDQGGLRDLRLPVGMVSLGPGAQAAPHWDRYG